MKKAKFELMPKDLDEAVLWTIAWFMVLNYVPTLEEIECFLLGMKADLFQIEHALDKNINISNSTSGNKKYYYLNDFKDLVNYRFYQEKISQKLWAKVKRSAKIFARSPNLQFVGVGNTLAFGCPDKNSDIDLFVTTKKNYIWSGRFALTFSLHWRGLRRHDKKIAEKFCLSFFANENKLNFAELTYKNDIYLAFWILTLVPIFDAKNFYGQFLTENLWALDFFPNYKPAYHNSIRSRSFIDKCFYFLGCLLFNQITEKLLKLWLCKRAKKKNEKSTKKASIVISDEMLKFHEYDARKDFLNDWKKIIKKY